MRGRVYWNLHKDCYSIIDWEPRSSSYGRLIEDRPHRPEVWLKDVKFIVQPAGRRRVLKENRKNVHAYLEGQLGVGPAPDTEFTIFTDTTMELWKSVTYNPYFMEEFQAKGLFSSSDPIRAASWIVGKTHEFSGKAVLSATVSRSRG